MISPNDLAAAFGRNVMIVKRQTGGLTHEDSLLQLPFRGNCLNWVLGHIATNRDVVLAALGEEPVMGAGGTRYKRESEPLTDPNEKEGVLPLQELIHRLEQSQERITAALGRMSDADMEREVEPDGTYGKSTVAGRVFFLYFHETYHLGQTELLRQLAGKEDKII